MGKRNTKELFFNEGVAGVEGDFLLAGLFYEYEGTADEVTRIVGVENNEWYLLDDVDGIVISLHSLQYKGQIATMAITRSGSSALVYGEQRIDASVPIDAGYLFHSTLLGDGIVACGSQNQVWRWEAGRWSRLGTGAAVNSKTGPKDALYGICTTVSGGVVAVGTMGKIVRFDGRGWSDIESPTNLPLHKVLELEDGELVTVGRAGKAFRGTPTLGWHTISIDGMEDNLWALCRFRGRLYCASSNALFAIDGNELVPVAVGKYGPKRFTRLFANDVYMYATTGTDEIFRFDGGRWNELVCPENS